MTGVIVFAAFIVCLPATAGTIDLASGNLTDGNLKVTEIGDKSQYFLIYPTWTDSSGKTHFFKYSNDPDAPAKYYYTYIDLSSEGQPLPGAGPDDRTRQGSVELNKRYFDADTGWQNTTNYEQTTGDPGTLFASAFQDGIMTTSLEDWFIANAVNTPIFQPDFNLVGGGDVYYGVNLADLISLGAAFVNSHSFGDAFTIDSSGHLPELPDYVFSSTPLDYTPGVGWTGTPLAPGTQLEYIATHRTEYVPEPGALLSLVAGSAGLFFLWFRRQAVAGGPVRN